MAMYGLAIISLLKLLAVDDVTQKWYPDDGNAVGKLSNLRTVLDKIVSLGNFFRYHVKASKCQFIVKDENLGEAQKIFANTGITIKAGAGMLVSVIGSESECKKFLEFQQNEQIKILKKLTKIAKTSPENVYACYTKGVREKLSFLARKTPNTMENLEICENIIKEQLLPNLVYKDTLNPQFREISSLPLKVGGLNIKLPSDYESYLEWSKETSLVLESQGPNTAVTQKEKICTKIKKLKTDRTNRKEKTNLINSSNETDKYAIDLASEKGASNWLNALPMSRYNSKLKKSEFRDGIYLRYGWEPTKTPLTCACGADFNLTHALDCAKGGYTHIRHNEIRDTFANLNNEVCHDVEIEPKLQPLQGESFVNNLTTTEDEVRLDIKANGLWGSRFSRAFCDVKIFYPMPKHRENCIRMHTNTTKR